MKKLKEYNKEQEKEYRAQRKPAGVMCDNCGDVEMVYPCREDYVNAVYFTTSFEFPHKDVICPECHLKGKKIDKLQGEDDA